MSALLAQNRRSGLFNDEHDAFRESVRTHLERTVVGELEVWDRTKAVPREALQAAAEHGFIGTGISEEHGGLGLEDPRFAVVVAEEAARVGALGLALVLLAHDDVPVRALRGSALEAWTAPLATAEELATSALDGRVRAELAAGELVLHGVAEAAVNAAGADVVIVAAAADDGPVIAAVRTSDAGVGAEPTPPPIGLGAAGLGDIRFDGARLPADRVLASGGDAARMLESLRSGARVALAAMAAGSARAALDITLEYVRDRRAFGQPIASFQNSRQLLGQVAAELEAAELMVDDCLSALVDGQLAPTRAAAVKVVATDVHARAVDVGVQLHGGYGYIMEYAIAGAFADARFLRLHGGTTQALLDEVGQGLA